MRLQWYLHQRFVTRILRNMHVKYIDSLLPGNVKAHFWGEDFAIHIPQSKMLGCIHIQHSFSVHFLCIRHVLLFLCGDRGNKMEAAAGKQHLGAHALHNSTSQQPQKYFSKCLHSPDSKEKAAGRVFWPRFLCPKDLATLIGEKEVLY